MSMVLRLVLIASAFLVLLFVMRKIKKCQIQAMDSVFWIFFSCSFVILALFPQVAMHVSKMLGFQASSNFVFLYVVGVLVVRDFGMTVKYAQLRDKMNALVQELAVSDAESRKKSCRNR